MEVTLEKNAEALEALIRVKVQESDYQQNIDKKIKEYAKKAQINGFRQGKVPPMVIKKMYGKSIKVDEVNQAAAESLYNYLRAENLQIFGSPMIALDKMESIDWDNGKDIEFVYEIGLQPEVAFDFNKDFTVKEYKVAISESDVNNFINNMRERFAEYADKEEVSTETDVWGRLVPTSEEVLMLDDKEFTKGKEFFGLVNMSKLPEANQAIFLGKKVGEEVTFDLRTVFPTDADLADFLRFAEEDLKDIKGEVVFTINNISTRTLPEMNADFFGKALGKPSDEMTEEEFKAGVLAILQKRYDISAKMESMLSFIDEMTQKINVNLPDAFLRKWLATQENRKDMSDEEYANVQKGLQTQIIIEQLSKQNELEITEEELRAYAREVQMLNLFSMGFLNGLGDDKLLDMFVDRMFEDAEDERNNQNLMTFERNIKAGKLMEIYSNMITVEPVTHTGESFDLAMKA